MCISILHGIEKIYLKEQKIRNISELKRILNGKLKDEDFSVEINGHVLESEKQLNELKGTIKICYKKKFCDYIDCRLKRSKVCSNCRFCEYLFCGRHRMPEEHSCVEMKRCKEEANLKNANKLEEGRINKNKI